MKLIFVHPEKTQGGQSVLLCLMLAACLGVIHSLCGQSGLGPSVEILLSNGQTVRGQLRNISESAVVIQVGKEQVTKELKDVLQLSFNPDANKPGVAPNAPQTQVRLIDGTTLSSQSASFRGKQVECRLFNGQAVSFSLDSLHWILFTAQDPAARAELEQTLAKKPVQDVVLVLSRDQKAINAFSGVVLGGDEKGAVLNFRLDEDIVPIDMARLRGIILARRSDVKVTEAIKIADRFGNVWMAKSLSWEKNKLLLSTMDGHRTELELNQVALVDFSQGRLAFLSDMEPLRVEEKPLLANIWRYRRDRNLAGGPISLGQRIYHKGLAVHSRTILEYHVEGYREFRCVLGIEDSISVPAKAIVRIEGDGRELFQATLTTTEKPRELALSIEGVRRLRLIVDYGDDLDLGDHVVFADARVLK